MLTITNKTKRGELVAEIERQRAEIELLKAQHTRTIELISAEQDAINGKLLESRTEVQNLKHKAEVLETDVQNLLGALRVFADSARTVRIRRKSVQDANLATALPYRNTEEL